MVSGLSGIYYFHILDLRPELDEVFGALIKILSNAASIEQSVPVSLKNVADRMIC